MEQIKIVYGFPGFDKALIFGGTVNTGLIKYRD